MLTKSLHFYSLMFIIKNMIMLFVYFCVALLDLDHIVSVPLW